MAIQTNIKMRGSMFYQVFVRNYSNEGTFLAVTADLERIKALGTDVIHLLPIHPIGEKNRKGSLGSPYAIMDYESVDASYGTEDDLQHLLKKAHNLGMKVLMDVVYNHTSPDSKLFSLHPEWFYRKNGMPGNKVGDWWDVRDLDFEASAIGLNDYLIKNLERWAQLGFDGFRCDVASLVPREFWLQARKAIERIKPDAIWLAESVHAEFIRELRRQGFRAHSDCELFDAFDICYEYDVHDRFHEYASNSGSLKAYKQALRAQEANFPANFVKLRFLGNHDVARPAALFKDRGVLEAWTAFTFFNKGAVLVYMGDETLTDHRPSLFEKEPIDWTKTDAAHVELIRRLASLKKGAFFTESNYYEVMEDSDEDFIIAFHEKANKRLYGIFNVGMGRQNVQLGIPDGTYEALFGADVKVKGGKVLMESRYAIIETMI